MRVSSLDSSLPQVSLSSNVLGDFDRAVKKEWLITNGLGTYASSTVLGLNTRKYHGLLVAAFNPPVDRRVLLARLDEEIHTEGQNSNLGTNEDKQGVQPKGYSFLTDFSISPFPTWTYRVERKFELKKTLIMPYGKNVSIISYQILNNSGADLKTLVVPIVSFRHFHSVTLKDQAPWSYVQKPSDQHVVIHPSTEASTLILSSTDGRYVAGQGEWVESFYRVEAERGESNLDYGFNPGFFELEMKPNEVRSFFLLAASGRNEDEAKQIFSSVYKDRSVGSTVYANEVKRRADLLKSFQKHYESIKLDDWLKWLILAADTFVVNRESTKTKSVIAGYHWFADWGRDSLISLPGLTLVTGRFDEAKKILLTFGRYCREGLIPNYFPDSLQDEAVYNTVDATLWFVNAVLQFLKYTNEFQFVHESLWPTLKSIIDYHVRGTSFNIRVDQNGLLSHGSQLTWMDAERGTTPITPREGKAVEIQALWYNALRIMQLLASHFEERDKIVAYGTMAQKAQRSFMEEFWNPQKECLFDVVVNDSTKDDSLRPNQIFAVALDFTVLDKTMAEKVVETVWKQLLTPYGLRTLPSSDPRYIGEYSGSRWQRDQAYHNGTIWPWLQGPFITAFLKVKNRESHWRNFAFENFLKSLFNEGLHLLCEGSLSEVADGDPPYEPNGCIAQAWSVSEPLRAYIEDVLLKRPPFEQKALSFKIG